MARLDPAGGDASTIQVNQQMKDNPVLLAVIVLTPLATPFGVVVRCNAAGGAADQDLTAFMADATEAMAKAHGAVASQCLTKRRGLVEKLKARGYRVAGYLMQKDLQ
mgnify:CR=1 FL=1